MLVTRLSKNEAIEGLEHKYAIVLLHTPYLTYLKFQAELSKVVFTMNAIKVTYNKTGTTGVF